MRVELLIWKIPLSLVIECLFVAAVSYRGFPKKQTCFTDSNMASEFIVLSSASKEAQCLWNLMFEIT